MNLVEIYKKAHENVLKRYENEPEDKWKVDAIARARQGEKGHESIMYQFVKHVEQEVNVLLARMPKVAEKPQSGIQVAETVTPSVPPN